jgi:hypothetical protein
VKPEGGRQGGGHAMEKENARLEYNRSEEWHFCEGCRKQDCGFVGYNTSKEDGGCSFLQNTVA